MFCRLFRPLLNPPGFAAYRQRRSGWPRTTSFLPLSQPLAGQSSQKKPQRTKLGAMGEYYRALVVTEERVTKWPAPRDDVEYDVLRVSVNVHTN